MPLTWRQLKTQAETAQHHAWLHTASVMAMVANTARDPKKRRRPYTMNDFHPLMKSKRPARLSKSESVELLKDIFVRGRHR